MDCIQLSWVEPTRALKIVRVEYAPKPSACVGSYHPVSRIPKAFASAAAQTGILCRSGGICLASNQPLQPVVVNPSGRSVPGAFARIGNEAFREGCDQFLVAMRESGLLKFVQEFRRRLI